jgi:hypothetical protein
VTWGREHLGLVSPESYPRFVAVQKNHGKRSPRGHVTGSREGAGSPATWAL